MLTADCPRSEDGLYPGNPAHCMRCHYEAARLFDSRAWDLTRQLLTTAFALLWPAVAFAMLVGRETLDSEKLEAA